MPIRIEPTLTVTMQELEQAIVVLEQVFKEVNTRCFAPGRKAAKR